MSVEPTVIDFMMACYMSNNPEGRLGSARWNCESGREIRAWLETNGLISGSKPTVRGKLWVQRSISASPLPILSWKIPPRQSTVEEDWEKPIQQAAE